MPTTTINIGFRPPRNATLIDADNLSSLAAAAAANTQTSGGIYNPIVAVRDVTSAVDEVEAFVPDLVTVIGDPSPEQAAVLDAFSHRSAPRLSMRGPQREERHRPS
jgi:hypothetical protein